jgi:hypothetical protein
LDAGLNIQPILNHKSIFGRSGETEFCVRVIQPDEEKFQDPAAETVQNLDFLPVVKGLMGGRERGCLVGWTEPSRPLEHSAVLAPSRTLRAGAPRRGRCAASWTALARGALPIGRSGQKDVGFGRTEGCGLGQAAAGLP